ncbi:MAG: hypothetical protein C4308_00580 [Chitinophagaceae bacterium]
MLKRSAIIKLKRTGVAVLFIFCAAGAFATLGDGKGKNPKERTLLMHSQPITKGNFTLKSGYDFRGNKIINPDNNRNYINLNTFITYEKGNTTYIIPLKKKIYINSTGSGVAIHH